MNEDEFQVQRDAGSGFQTIDSVGADSVAYSDLGLNAETSYTYRVRAVNSAGSSPWTNEVAETTLPVPLTAPPAPTSLAATSSNADEIILSWSHDSDKEEGFEVERDRGAGFVLVATLTADKTGYRDSGLDSETSYTYRVRATNSVGSSAWSNEDTATTHSLTAPSGLTASAVGTSAVDLSWTDRSLYESAFEIERDDGSIVVTFDVPANTTTHTDSGLDSYTLYTYRIRAMDPGGTSDPSSPASARTVIDTGDAVPFSAGGVTWEMHYVPGGTFPTGIYDEGDRDFDLQNTPDVPSPSTVSSPYLIGRTEVTYELYDAVYDWSVANGYAYHGQGTMGQGTGVKTNLHPVAQTTWYDCVVWCNALTEYYNAHNSANLECVYQYGVNPIRDATEANWDVIEPVQPTVNADGFRLLMYDEWELAARWRNDSTNTVPGYSDPWFTRGDSASGAVANFDDESATNAVSWNEYNATGTHEVGGKLANALGLYDMSGNVPEWCFDWMIDDYTSSNRHTGGGGFNHYYTVAIGYGSGSNKAYDSSGLRIGKSYP